MVSARLVDCPDSPEVQQSKPIPKMMFATGEEPVGVRRDEVALSQDNVAVKGFALALQLVLVEAVPALTEVVQETCSSSESDSEDDGLDPDPKKVVEVYERYEAVGDQFLLVRNQMVENDRERNANREALTALRKKAKTTKTRIPSPFNSMMKDAHGSSTKALVQEVCSTCGSHDSTEPTWMMLPGTDIFAAVPFHVVHTMLEKHEKRMEFESKKLQSLLKEKTLLLSELGALVDSVPPSVIRKLATQTVVFHLWKQRNNLIHNQTSLPVAAVFRSIDKELRNVISSRRKNKIFRDLMAMWLR
ncbi:hypothetical protein DY000_02001757 [Brassica cretica]|uniref:P53 and DNA damage-regulated protein 1 n=1 Tax=Brassica cretica TaxID=69181 RepID=A0ABQ7CCK9_BRACR|nr:hypothetical protein DY000_02001757 [Brassica cretica]